MDVFKLNGRAFNVNVLDLTEGFTITYSSNTGRAMSAGAPIVLDPLGSFFTHTVTVSAKKGYETEFDELWDFVSKPRFKGVQAEVVHNQDAISYEAYVSQGKRPLKKIDPRTGKKYWGEMSINIIPVKAQVLP